MSAASRFEHFKRRVPIAPPGVKSKKSATVRNDPIKFQLNRVRTSGCETKIVKVYGPAYVRTDGHVRHSLRSTGDDLESGK